MYMSKMAMEPQQNSPMSKMDETRLPSTLWLFLFQVSKNDDEERCFLKVIWL